MTQYFLSFFRLRLFENSRLIFFRQNSEEPHMHSGCSTEQALRRLRESIGKQAEKPLKDQILTCKDFEECRKLLLTESESGNYFFDPDTGNYLKKSIFPEGTLLHEPLVSQTLETGKKRRKLRLKKTVMTALKEADDAMQKKTGEGIIVDYSFRSNERQFGIFQELTQKNARVAPPGCSFHETGQAIDVENWEKAEPYLLAKGFVGGNAGMSNDKTHFSMGEMKSGQNFVS